MKRLVFLLFCVSASAHAVSTDYLDKAFSDISKEVGVSESLLRAICWVESRHKPYSYLHADAGAKNHAFGVCQVLYSTAKGMGLVDPKCKGDFSKTSLFERVYQQCKLFGPRTNIRYAAKYLKSRLQKYNGNEFKAIAAYNAGSYKICRNGWLHVKGVRFKRCVAGGPINIYYINRVLQALEKER